MESLQKLQSFLIPEFKEEDIQDNRIMKTKIASDDNILSDIEELEKLQESLNKWGIPLFDKKKVARVDFDEYVNMCNKLTILIVKIEAKYQASANNSVKLAKIDNRLNFFKVAKVQTRKPAFAECVQLLIKLDIDQDTGTDSKRQKMRI